MVVTYWLLGVADKKFTCLKILFTPYYRQKVLPLSYGRMEAGLKRRAQIIENNVRKDLKNFEIIDDIIKRAFGRRSHKDINEVSKRIKEIIIKDLKELGNLEIRISY